MPLYAGMDWTSYRKSHRQILGCAIVAVSDLEFLASAFREARRMSSLPKEHMFHAYTDAPKIQLALLQAVMKADMNLRVGALFYDSADGVQEIVSRLTAQEFTHHIGVGLLREFIPVYPIAKLVVDSELEGRKQETNFKKEGRAQRDQGYFAHAPKIEFSVSKKSELIQLADLLVYNLYRRQRGVLEPEMQRLMNAICRDSNNIIRKFQE